MRLLISVIILLHIVSVNAAEQELQLGRAEWSVPKSAGSRVGYASITEAMNRLQASANTQLRVYYPGGDEGSLWAVELRGWLVSLGLEAARIKLISGSQYPDRLQLQIE